MEDIRSTVNAAPSAAPRIFHLTPAPHWEQQAAATDFVAETFATDGFIHCTIGEQAVLDVGNRYYRDDPRPYVLLEIVPERLSAPVRHDDDSGRYPHVYGPIHHGAISRVRSIQRHVDGTFLAVGPDSLMRR